MDGSLICLAQPTLPSLGRIRCALPEVRDSVNQAFLSIMRVVDLFPSNSVGIAFLMPADNARLLTRRLKGTLHDTSIATLTLREDRA
jgi:hypothetical protein